MNKLLVNADDFGMHPLINESVVRLAESGAVNSVSVMTNAAFADYSTLRALQQNGIFVGVHIAWVRSNWLTDCREIFSWRAFAAKLIASGEKFKRDLDAEAKAQIERLLENGIVPDHLDSHQHVHHFPAVWKIMQELSAHYSIRRIRCCKAATSEMQRRNAGGFFLQRLAAHYHHPVEHFYVAGLKYPGNYSFDKIASELTASHGYDTEFITHPAMETETLHQLYPDWRFNWKKEFHALHDERLPELIAACNFYLPKRDCIKGSGNPASA